MEAIEKALDTCGVSGFKAHLYLHQVTPLNNK